MRILGSLVAMVAYSFGWGGQRYRQYGAASVGSVCGIQASPKCLYKSPRDRKAKTGSRDAPVGCFRAIKFVEDMGQCLRRNAKSFILDREQNPLFRRTSADTNRGSQWRVFGGIVQEIHDRLFEQQRIGRNQRKIVGQIEHDTVARQPPG